MQEWNTLRRITVNCLKMFGYEPTQAGLAKAMKDGTVCAIASLKRKTYY